MPPIRLISLASLTFALTCSAIASADPAQTTSKTDFLRDIQPIFQAHCYKCHGPEKQKGQFRLDVRQSAMQGGVTGKLFKAKDSAASLVIRRVLGQGDEDRMPLKSDPLSEKQIATLKIWIDQGADWPESATADAKIQKHWAYVKPVRPATPTVKTAGWPRNPIDNFVLAHLEKAGLHPSAEAERAILIRRLSLDLVGLPPKPAEVDAFLADTRPDAYERFVDRLLASPHFGERWARPWLDLARYADTNGYEADAQRTMWKYRDWVIDALNRDLSFKQFTIDQIAGDMLPDATTAEKIASGFHRNTMLNLEGGVDRAEARWLTLVDRVTTTAQVWLGSTLQCTQCHNHKYDPFSQKEFYQLLAAWENSDEPNIQTLPPDQEARKKNLDAEIAGLDKTLNTPTAALAAAQKPWESEVAATGIWHVLDPSTFLSARGATLSKLADNSILARDEAPPSDTYTFVATTDLKQITAIRIEALPDDSLPAKGPGRASNGNFVLSRLQFSIAPRWGDGSSTEISLAKPAADYSQPSFSPAAAINTGADGKSGWAVDGRIGRAHVAIFETGRDIGFDAGTKLIFKLEQSNQNPTGHTIGRFRISVSTSARPVRLPTVPDNIAALTLIAADERTEKQKNEIAAYFRTISPILQPTRDRIAQLKETIAKLNYTSAMVFQEKPTKDRPTTDFHTRGSWLNKGEKVQFDVPAVLNPLPKDMPPNRLALAKWLVDENNPLTARVAVNRYWEALFGHGLVETTDDFGTQGERPTNPELLDWLATEFMQNGWSTKQILRTIVTSATYRQSSRVSRELFERDPYNRLFARGPRFRMEAELLRDNALAISGLLSEKTLGPSVFPVQPEGIWNVPYSGERWTTSTGEDLYRRGLYTFWRRSAPYPMFVAFDAPSREICVARRVRTNTPLQALNILNDPAFVETSKTLASRIIAEAPNETRARITHGLKLCFARQPRSEEIDRLLALYNAELADYKKDAAAAKAMSNGVLYPEDMGAPEAAAWAVVCNVLLNLDETMTKG